MRHEAGAAVGADAADPAVGLPKSAGSNRRSHAAAHRGAHDRRDRRDRRPSGEGPRKLDLSTSFEKDYKRPKPEDSLNAGVYGKIDI